MGIKNIILDTDIGPDCDDAAALAVLNILSDQGYCHILGISHCTSNPYGAGTIDAINRYYGRPDVTISTYGGKGFLTDETCMRYNRYITTHYANRYQLTQPEEAVGMYRRILSAQEDGSVEIIGIGPMNNLSDLLESGADHYSKLDGFSLIRKKVSRLTLMAGAFPCSSEAVIKRAERIEKEKIENMAEYNVKCDVKAARNVSERWPTPKSYLGFEAGLILTGAALYKYAPQMHPVRMAYQLHGNWKEGRFSWDPLTVEYAIVDGSPHFKESVRGIVRFDEMGRTIWKPDENGQDCFVELTQEEKVIADMEALLMTPPRGLGQTSAEG